MLSASHNCRCRTLSQGMKNDVSLSSCIVPSQLVMALQISDIIGNVSKLVLQVQGDGEVAISHRWQRLLRYQPVAPSGCLTTSSIEVEGV